MRRGLRALVAFTAFAVGLNVITPPAGAEGTENLGPMSIATAAGTGTSVGGIGLTGKTSGQLNISVPAGATVKQVLLHWSGLHKSGTSGDGSITVNGVATTGTKIGGPTYWYKTYNVTSYRANITSRGLVKPGANALTIGGMGFNVKNNGVGATVVYDNGSTQKSTIVLRDGVDLAQAAMPEPRKTTKAQVFTFPASEEPRQAAFLLQVGDVGTERPHRVVVKVGAVETVLPNYLANVSGPEWDSIKIPVSIPAKVTTASVQILSGNDGSTGVPASIIWVAAGMDVPPAVLCQLSKNPASATGRAFGVEASLLNNAIPIPATPDTNTQNPAELLAVALPPPPQAPVISDVLFRVVNDKEVTATQAVDVALATTNELSIPDAGVSAKTVVARAESHASGTDAGSTFMGSVVQDLVIGGEEIGDVTHPQTHTVKDPSTGKTVVRVDVLGVTRTGAAAGVVQPEGSTATSAGDYKSGISVDALRVRTYDPILGLLINDITVGHAESSASFPSAQRCKPQPHVVGEAFTSRLGNVNPDVVESTTGLVVLPSTGGDEKVNVLTLAPIGLGVGTVATKGALSPLGAESSAEVVDLDLQGQVLAEAVTAWTKSGTSTPADTGGAKLVEVVLGGTNICQELQLTDVCTPAPNTVLLDQDNVIVVLNEQIVSPGGGITVNAIHIYIVGKGNPYGLPVGAELIISSATSDAVPA